jgi:hypothetical protein
MHSQAVVDVAPRAKAPVDLAAHQGYLGRQAGCFGRSAEAQALPAIAWGGPAVQVSRGDVRSGSKATLAARFTCDPQALADAEAAADRGARVVRSS